MRVKTIKPHQNACGDKVAKAKGDEYECSEKTGKQLAALGIVEEVKAKAESK
jgi:hypothetical protein